jgi:hypothetical protein
MQFIYSKPKALPSELCEELIATFENSTLKKPGVINQNDKVATFSHIKQSTDLCFTPEYEQDPVWGPLLKPVLEVLHTEVDNYAFKFKEAIYTLNDFRLETVFNIQRYLPGEAYKAFHCERGGITTGHRILVWMFYLNDIEDGGETEFLYLNKRIKPKAGRLVIWPASYIHAHRGNPPLSGSKYIITSWLNYF